MLPLPLVDAIAYDGLKEIRNSNLAEKSLQLAWICFRAFGNSLCSVKFEFAVKNEMSFAPFYENFAINAEYDGR
jgi:hypothetical protein